MVLLDRQTAVEQWVKNAPFFIPKASLITSYSVLVKGTQDLEIALFDGIFCENGGTPEA